MPSPAELAVVGPAHRQRRLPTVQLGVGPHMARPLQFGLRVLTLVVAALAGARTSGPGVLRAPAATGPVLALLSSVTSHVVGAPFALLNGSGPPTYG
jgi:hypothetical protein